jgi:hypothetical protein
MPGVRTALVFVIAACVLPRTAHAGRSFYGWLYGTEVMPERGVELQSWVQEENEKYETRVKESWLAWGPWIGITDHLELGLPVELEWLHTEIGPGMPVPRTSFTFRRFGIEARYRLVSPDPVDAPALAPLIRIAVKRDVTQRENVRLEGDAVVSYDAGAVQALVDLGATADLSSSSQHVELHPGAGVSVRVTDELRVGAEIYSELSTRALSESWATAGPNVSWTHGRFWLSGAFGIGFYHLRVAPRVIWGIAF